MVKGSKKSVDDNTQSTTTTSQPTSTTNTPAASTTNSGIVTKPVASTTKPQPAEFSLAAVSIKGYAFTPATITVKRGAMVTWTNEDLYAHTVTANDGSFASKQLNKGETFSHTFSKAGTYTYYCQLHPTMKGTIVVTQ